VWTCRFVRFVARFFSFVYFSQHHDQRQVDRASASVIAVSVWCTRRRGLSTERKGDTRTANLCQDCPSYAPIIRSLSHPSFYLPPSIF